MNSFKQAGLGLGRCSEGASCTSCGTCVFSLQSPALRALLPSRAHGTALGTLATGWQDGEAEGVLDGRLRSPWSCGTTGLRTGACWQSE